MTRLAPGAGDTLVVNGTSAADTINFTPSAANAASITGAGLVPINAATIEQIILNGQGGNDTLTVTTPAAATRITDTIGARPIPARSWSLRWCR